MSIVTKVCWKIVLKTFFGLLTAVLFIMIIGGSIDTSGYIHDFVNRTGIILPGILGVISLLLASSITLTIDEVEEAIDMLEK